MTAPNNQILFKVEDALAIRLATITASLGGATIHKGGEGDEHAVPYVSVLAPDAVPMKSRSGNWRVSAEVGIWTSADDTGRATRVSIAGAIADLLAGTGLAVSLSSDVADFRVFGVLVERPSQRTNGRRHSYTISMLINCCGSDV